MANDAHVFGFVIALSSLKFSQGNITNQTLGEPILPQLLIAGIHGLEEEKYAQLFDDFSSLAEHISPSLLFQTA